MNQIYAHSIYLLLHNTHSTYTDAKHSMSLVISFKSQRYGPYRTDASFYPADRAQMEMSNTVSCILRSIFVYVSTIRRCIAVLQTKKDGGWSYTFDETSPHSSSLWIFVTRCYNERVVHVESIENREKEFFPFCWWLYSVVCVKYMYLCWYYVVMLYCGCVCELYAFLFC